MASIGLTVKDSSLGSNLGLGDILAQGLFSDPTAQAEAAAKAQAIAAQIRAHDAYATKLGADTGLVQTKTREEQDAEAERLRAGPLVGAAAAGAVPAPVPVEAPRPESFGGYGPQPGIVRPEDLAQTDALRARERALGPILVRGTPGQVAEGVGKDYGGAILSGATINPAAVNPDALRIAGGLYTGTAPSTGTVWTGRDTAGQQAEAGKEIAVAAAKPPVPILRDINGGIVRVDPTGATATPVVGAEPQAKAPERQMIGDVLHERQPDGSWTPVRGPAAPAPEPLYPGKTPKDAALNRIAVIQQKLASGQPITPQEEAIYEADWNQAYGPSRTKSIDPQTGKPLSYSVYPSVPANTPSINDARKAVGLPPAPEPPADEFAPRVTPEQDKARSFADAAAHAETRLSNMTPKDIPGPVQTWIVTQDDPSLLMSLAQSAQDPKVRQWAQTMWEFTNAINRKESGQAITSGEWTTARQLYIPMPGNDEEALKAKHDARVLKIQDVANEGFRSDPNARSAFDQRWKGQGANLDMGGQTAPPVVTPKPPGAPADARQAPDGNWYVPDPARPGKYLQVK